MISAIVVAGGKGTRFGGFKQFVELYGLTVLEHSVRKFLSLPEIDEVVVVVHPDHLDHPAVKRLITMDRRVKVVPGGAERMDSVLNGVKASNGDILLIHDAARPMVSVEIIKNCVHRMLGGADSATVAIPVRDTLKRVKAGRAYGLIEREDAIHVQTPQCFRRALLLKAYEIARKQGLKATDDATLVELATGHEAEVVTGSPSNFKITYPEDIEFAEKLIISELRVGHGFDRHRLVPGRKFVLGGVFFPEVDFGPLGHSDGDALIHAIIDSLVSPCGLGDIGKLFPDSDPEFEGISSMELLRRVSEELLRNGCVPINIDATVLLQKPRIGKRTDEMRENIAEPLKIPFSAVQVKGKSGEGIGIIGRGEAVEVHVVSLIKRCK